MFMKHIGLRFFFLTISLPGSGIKTFLTSSNKKVWITLDYFSLDNGRCLIELIRETICISPKLSNWLAHVVVHNIPMFSCNTFRICSEIALLHYWYDNLWIFFSFFLVCLFRYLSIFSRKQICSSIDYFSYYYLIFAHFLKTS